MKRSPRIAPKPLVILFLALSIAAPGTLADVDEADSGTGSLSGYGQGSSSGWSGVPRLELSLAAVGGGHEDTATFLFKDPTRADGLVLSGTAVKGGASAMDSLFTAAAWVIGLGLLTLAGFNSRKRRGS
jgi:hypothetical protein